MNPLDHNLHLGAPRAAAWPVESDARPILPDLAALLRPWLGRTADTLELWSRRRRGRETLMRLDDYLLRDIGLSRAEAEAEWRKPFWRA